MNKEDKCRLLESLYAHLNSSFTFEILMKHNENQIDTLLSACKDDDGNYRKQEIDEK